MLEYDAYLFMHDGVTIGNIRKRVVLAADAEAKLAAAMKYCRADGEDGICESLDRIVELESENKKLYEAHETVCQSLDDAEAEIERLIEAKKRYYIAWRRAIKPSGDGKGGVAQPEEVHPAMATVSNPAPETPDDSSPSPAIKRLVDPHGGE